MRPEWGERYLPVSVVLGKIDWSLEGFYGDLTAVCEVDGVVDTGGHAFPYFLDGFEGGVKAELYDEFSAQDSTELLDLSCPVSPRMQFHGKVLKLLEDEAYSVGFSESVWYLAVKMHTCEGLRRI